MVANRTLVKILLAGISLLLVVLTAQYHRYTELIQSFMVHRRAYTIPVVFQNHSTPVLLEPLSTADYIEPRGKRNKPIKYGNIRKTSEKGDASRVRHIYPNSTNDFSMYGDEICPINKNRNILAKLFERWIEIAEREKIEYFLTCGSLLGSYRNGNIIPHDTDIDVLINREDFDKINAYNTKKKFVGTERDIFVYINKDFHLPYEKRRRFSCKGKEVPAYMDHCSFQEPLGRLITENHHLDIYDYKTNGTQLWDPSEGGRTFQKTEVFPLRRCFFMGYDTKCPNKPREFLMKFYGNNLRPLKVCKNGKWVKRTS